MATELLFEGAFPMPFLCSLIVIVAFYVQIRTPKRSFKRIPKKELKSFSADQDGWGETLCNFIGILEKSTFPGASKSGPG